MKYNYITKSLLLIFAMIMSVCGAWADTVTWDWTQNVSTSADADKVTYVDTKVTMVVTKGSATVGANNYLGNGETRVYKGNNITITPATNYKISSITITSSNSTYAGNWKNSTWGNASSATDASDNKVTIVTPTNGANPVTCTIGTATRAKTIVITLTSTGGSSKTLSSVAVSGTPTKTTYFDGDKFDPAGLVVTGTYSDSNTETITSGITWNVTPETLTTGTTSVSVTATVGEITSASYTVNGLTVNKYPYIKDKLTQAVTGVTGTGYDNFSGKSVVSDAVYAGNCAGGSGSVQLRSTNPSGVISTTSGGYIRKVSVEWNSSTTAGRVLDVYGSNTAYTSAADLYDTKKCGTKLGSITYGSSTSLTITGDYAYVGVRSASGAMYLTSVTFEWSPVSPVTFRQAGKGYSTLYTSETALSIPEGVEAYYCTLKENGNMEPHALTSVIPASTPVVLHYTGELTADKTINFAHSIEEGEDASTNVLRGTDEALNITSMTDNDFYVLSIVDGQVGFYKFGGDELAAGKAYYMTDKTPAGGDFTYEFHDEYVTVTPPAGYEGDYFVSAYSAAMLEIMTLQELVDDDVYFYFDMLTFNGALDIYYTEICFNDGDEYTLYISKRDNDGLVGTPVTCQFVINDHKQLVSHASTRGFILDFGFDGTTTGVSNVQTIAPAAKASFDLQGRRVKGAAKGLVIKNGRVMLNR